MGTEYENIIKFVETGFKDIERYLEKKPEYKLHIRYDKDNKMSHLKYMGLDKSTIEAKMDIVKISGENRLAWNVEYIDKFKAKRNCRIIAAYITKAHIINLVGPNHTANFCNYSMASRKDDDTFTINLAFEDNIIEVKFDKVINIAIDKNRDIETVKAYNTDTNQWISTYYIDDSIFYINNLEENVETLYLNNQNIVYEFKNRDLSISNYLQFRHPFRVTNYSTNKQYELEYDDNGIMKSMIEISDPEKELCIYKRVKLGDNGSYHSVSVHPNIYDPFDKHAITEIDSNLVAIESFNNFFPIESTSYIKKLVKIEE